MKKNYPILILFSVFIITLFGCADTSSDEETTKPGDIQISGPTNYNDSTEIVYTNNYTYTVASTYNGGIVTMTITNIGEGDLNLTNLPLTLSGTDASDFSIESQPIALLEPNTETTFKIKFTDDFTGIKNAQLDIKSDDPDLTTFTFALTGITC